MKGGADRKFKSSAVARINNNINHFRKERRLCFLTENFLSALRSWRSSEARRRRVPAYCILRDRVMLNIAAQAPATEEQLLGIKGLGPGIVGKHGEAILGLIRQTLPSRGSV